MIETTELRERASRIQLLLMDCDGVLTDGRVWLIESNEDQKAFNTKDGLGLELLHRAGIRTGIVSGRFSTAVERRASALGISYVFLGNNDKISAFEETLIKSGVGPEAVAFIGDDLNDIPLMRRSALAVAVADAAEEARNHAHYVTKLRGGRGAVRETVELILKSQGRWEEVIEPYLTR